MFLANVRLSGRTVLAPLAGISDSSFRLICKQNGVALVFSEMVSSEGLVRNDRKSNQYLEFLEDERPFGIQLFGADPEIMGEAVKIVEQKKPDIIDLNFGCPVRKVVKKGAGAAILKDLKLLQKITLAVTKATSIPVTAKIRSGWSVSQINAVEVAKILEDSGISAVTIHPRTQIQYFKNCSNWNIISEVKQAVSIPVIGNGDIRNHVDAQQMLQEIECDFVMIGRGALGNPWIFNQINTYLETGVCSVPTIEQILDVCIQHLKLAIKQKGNYRGIREMRKHLAWYIKGLPRSSSFRASLFKITDSDEAIEKLTAYFKGLDGEKDN